MPSLTIDEIRDWSRSDDIGKKAVWAQIAKRLRETHPSVLA